MEGKILLLDIETLPALGFFWDKPWETSIIEVVKQWQILSFSAKWLNGSQETHIDHASDRVLIKKLWKFLDQAEIVVAHNGDKFDIRKINARMLFYGMPPPSSYRTIDTLKVARKHFAMLSNKQDDLGAFLKTGRKLKTDKSLWLDCIKGDRLALKEMAEYNAQDVVLLEKNYLKLLPWISNHPSLDNYSDKTVCPKCGSQELQRRGFKYTNTRKYQSIWCKKCNGWSRSPVSDNEKKENIKRPLVSI